MKTVLVTGVGKGFGKEILLKLLGEYDVISHTVLKDIDFLVSEIGYAHTNLELILGDVSDDSFLEQVLNPLLIEKRISMGACQ